jgi:mannose-6-phosphate isomerase-like protein (cupin superfamily)
MRPMRSSSGAAPWIVIGLAAGLIIGTAKAQDGGITVTNLDRLLRQHPLPPGTTSDIVAERAAGDSKLQVVVETKIPLHVHADTDHMLYIARGKGIAHLAGQMRKIKPGDILFIPHGIEHGFEKDPLSGNIVMLVVETSGH